MPPIVDHHHRHHSQIDTDKQPIKWMQLPIAKFNEVAVPHHVNQLKLLKMSIQKNLRAGDWAGAHRDQVNASVVVKQLQTLVNEMDILRNRVIDSDLPKFDKLINSSRQAAINILQEFIELSQQPPREINPFYEDEEEVANEENEYNSKQLQLSLETSRLAAECQQQERCAVAWENLQREIEQVHQLFEELGEIVHTQGEAVNEIETNVEVTTEEVTQGEKHLAKAADLNVAAYPLCGAIIGSCLGGPIGVVAGIKIGTLVGLTGSILGFAGGRVLKDSVEESIKLRNTT